MYLSGLQSLSNAPIRVILGNSQSMRETDARQVCAGRGGILAVEPMNYRPGTPQIETPINNFVCTIIPDSRAAAPVAAPVQSSPVTVNTNTQVSPQISPVFVQQDEPVNSPVSATPVQSAPAQQSGAGPSQGMTAEDIAAIQQREAQARAESENRWQALIERLAPKESAPLLIPVYDGAQQFAPSSPTVVQVPSYIPVASTTTNTDAADSITLPTPFGPSELPVSTFQKYVPWVAGGILVWAIWMRKRKG